MGANHHGSIDTLCVRDGRLGGIYDDNSRRQRRRQGEPTKQLPGMSAKLRNQGQAKQIKLYTSLPLRKMLQARYWGRCWSRHWSWRRTRYLRVVRVSILHFYRGRCCKGHAGSEQV